MSSTRDWRWIIAVVGLGSLVAGALVLIAAPTDNGVYQYVQFMEEGDSASAFSALCDAAKKPGLAAFVRGASAFSEAEDFSFGRGSDGFVPISFRMKGERFDFTVPVSKQSGLRMPGPESPDDVWKTRSVEYVC